MKNYEARLRDGRSIFIPSWPIDVALENLTKAGKYLGTENIINISAINVPAVVVAIMSASDPAQAAALIKHFLCTVRIEGDKILPETINAMFEGDLSSVTEIFAHIIHAQYHDFFESGLAKVASQES